MFQFVCLALVAGFFSFVSPSFSEEQDSVPAPKLVQAEDLFPILAFIELGSTPAGQYVEIADDLLCSDNNADTCRSPVDKTKLKQRLVTYEHWAMGYLSAHLNGIIINGASGELKNLSAILTELKTEVRTRLMQEFILRLKISSRLKPKQQFGEAVLEVGQWLEKELIKRDCNSLLTEPRDERK